MRRARVAAIALLLAACAPAAWRTGADAALPDDIERALQTDRHVLDCPSGTRNGVSLFEPDWVVVQRIDLNGDARADWLLRGVHPCLRRDGPPDWWLYAEGLRGRRLLGVQRAARSVEALRSRSHGWRDLRVRDGSGVRIVRYRGDGY